MLLPRFKAEYLYDLDGNAGVRVAYTDLAVGSFSSLPLTGFAREQLTLGLGTELEVGTQLGFELDYLGRIAPGAGTDHSIQAGVNLKF